MKQIIGKLNLFLIATMLTTIGAWGQGSNEHVYSIDSLFNLALNNNQSLKLSSTQVDIAQQRISVAKSQQLPNISASASAYYLGDVSIYDSNLSNKINSPMPHNGRSFSIQASQLIFKGFAVSNAIKLASLQQQIATLNFEKNKQDIKLLISSYYLDLYRLRNQKQIYSKNIELSEIRLKNIEQMHEQGMVTNNDIIRSKLLLSNLKLALIQINDNIEILNSQIDIAVGLPSNVVILPDTTILTKKPVIQDIVSCQNDAFASNYDIKIAENNAKVAEKNISIVQAERSPSLIFFAGNSLQRPITTRTPVVDMYSNGWQAGFTLSYSIASLYNTPRNVKLSRLQLQQSQEMVVLQQQNISVAVHSVYLKYQEAMQQWETTKINKELANENYKTMERKYFNQLALFTDMADATNTKLDAELQHSNAEISILFTYYKLLSTTGRL